MFNMGWKNVKDHYRIAHIVRITEEGVCIGSPYIHDLIVIAKDGLIKKRYQERSNADLMRYQMEFDADPAKLHELILKPDSFGALTKVYTYDGSEIIEKYCEEVGYPNVTVDGDLMYENTYSDDKNKIISIAKRVAEAATNWATENVKNAEEALRKASEHLIKHQSDLAKLEADYPTN